MNKWELDKPFFMEFFVVIIGVAKMSAFLGDNLF
jgi:hypothetical protein